MNQLPANITRDLSKHVCEVRRAAKCYFISIFAIILNCFNVLCKLLLTSKLIAKRIS